MPNSTPKPIPEILMEMSRVPSLRTMNGYQKTYSPSGCYMLGN
jgi:hypothetical protein